MSTRSLLNSIADVYRTPGSYSTVYMDVSVDTGDPPQAFDERATSITDELLRQGAPQDDIDAILDALAGARTLGSPVTAFALAKDGEILVDELIPAQPLDQAFITHGSLPDLAPLLKHAVDVFSYIVVVTARDGGAITLQRVGRARPEQRTSLQGRTDTLHVSKSGGGWRQDYFQSHAEEIWRQTQSELASTVDDLVRRHRPRLLVIAGDIAARQLLAGELSTEAQKLVRILPVNVEADGSDPEKLADFIESEITALIRSDEDAVTDLVAMHNGRGDNRTEITFGGVVHALASAQVETLLIDEDRLEDREVLALDAPPWVATAPEDALGARVIESVPARLGLLRAALLTDARVLFARQKGSDEDPVELPESTSVAAVLRWTTGPAVPGIDDI